jgi:hypothetical protein
MPVPFPGAGARLACCAILLLATLGAAANSIGPQTAPVVRQAASTSGPQWKELPQTHQEVLKPLEPEWDRMPGSRKKKWLTMADKYSAMTPEQQARMQERMGAWATLTPDQRRIARENYARARKLQPDQRSAEWQQYQQLSEEERQKLAEQAKTKQRLTSLPPPHAQDKGKLTPPPKSALKKELQTPLVKPAAAPVVPPTPVTPATPAAPVPQAPAPSGATAH